MRIVEISLACLVLSLIAGCASGTKQELLAARIARDQLEYQNKTLKQQLDRTSRSLEAANQEIRTLTARMEDARQDFREDLAEQNVSATTCQKALSSCNARRIELENSKVGVLDRQLAQCRDQLPRYFDDGYSKGQLFFLTRVETTAKESNFSKVLSAITGLAGAAASLLPGPH